MCSLIKIDKKIVKNKRNVRVGQDQVQGWDALIRIRILNKMRILNRYKAKLTVKDIFGTIRLYFQILIKYFKTFIVILDILDKTSPIEMIHSCMLNNTTSKKLFSIQICITNYRI